MMHVEEIRSYCMNKEAVTESFPFDEETLVFKVGSKMFALIGLENPDRINLKCDPDRSLELREEWEEVQPGFHMSKKHWNTVFFNGRLRADLVHDLIDHSYALVVKGMPKKDREALRL